MIANFSVPSKDEDKNRDNSIPDYLLKLVEGCSTYAKVATKYWIACALISLFTLSATNISETKIQLPLDLPEISKTEFYPLALVIITVLFIAFGSATSQAIRARQLINRSLNNSRNRIYFDGNIYLQDIIDVIIYPVINRVAPLAQVLQGKKQFFPEAEDISNFRKNCALAYYALLKLAATVIVYGLPGYALYVCFQNINDGLVRLWNIPVFSRP